MTPADLPLLNECFAAGGTLALFPLLSGWPPDRLRQLLAEVDRLWDAAEQAYGADAVRPENFFRKQRSAALDATRFNLLSTLSEIVSMAQLYLGNDDPTPPPGRPARGGSRAAGRGAEGGG